MVSHVNANNAYTDLAGLNAIKAAGREDTADGLKQVAKQFEAVFLNMMLKSMRDSNKVFAEGNYLSSNEMDFYQQNFDDQLSLHLSSGKGLGLAEVLHRQMLRQYEVKEAATSNSTESQASASFSDSVDNVANNNARFSSPDDFVQRLIPHARKAAAELGADPKLLLAQSALETGWGRKLAKDSQGGNSHNLFGIKADSSWKGPVANTPTVEFRGGVAQQEQASFRRYSSYEDSFNDYVSFLKSNPRYQNALQHASNPKEFAQELQRAGYATDPEYGNKIYGVLNSPSMRLALDSAASGD